jgi:hypothetical protein
MMKPITAVVTFLVLTVFTGGLGFGADQVERNRVVEVELKSAKAYDNPFTEIELDVIFTAPDGKRYRVPAFWGGGDRWRFRYASGQKGEHSWRTECSDASNSSLHGVSGTVEVVEYLGDNPLYQHGQLRISDNGRHLEHVDGKPFFWLGDTWWKCLSKRMTWNGFQTLTADRKAKGFNVIHIVCGAYPDENHFQERWKNEGGFPYHTTDFRELNPDYFDYADRRIQHLVENGLVPAIVGGWGRADCNIMDLVGPAGMKRHWRYLIARYGAYPTIWITGGESRGPNWTETSQYVRETDYFDRPITMHPQGGASGRASVTDDSAVNLDMLQTGHGGWPLAERVIPLLKQAYDVEPAMPVIIGEHSYEQHMQTGFADVQRYVFWSSTLSGSAGLTYGAAGIWHAGVEGDPGLTHLYDRTTWREGMNFAGSTQLGYSKKLLLDFPWEQFESHPEWTASESFAAGIPGQVRFIYNFNARYTWQGLEVNGLEPGVLYRGFYFDPVKGTREDVGTVINEGRSSPNFTHSQAIIFEDDFESNDSSRWRDRGSATKRNDGYLVSGKNMLTTVNGIDEKNVLVTVDVSKEAEAGIILRYQDPNNYVVALYHPALKNILIQERYQGEWGPWLGKVWLPGGFTRGDVETLQLTAAVSGSHAVVRISNERGEYQTPVVPINNARSGKVGLRLLEVGNRQQFDNFAVSRTLFEEPRTPLKDGGEFIRRGGGDFIAPQVPTPQDWILVLERVED